MTEAYGNPPSGRLDGCQSQQCGPKSTFPSVGSESPRFGGKMFAMQRELDFSTSLRRENSIFHLRITIKVGNTKEAS